MSAATSSITFADHSSHGAASLGWSRELAPGTRVSLFAGPKVTSYRRPHAGSRTPRSMRTTNRIGSALDYWHGETIILGVVGPVRADSVTIRFDLAADPPLRARRPRRRLRCHDARCARKRTNYRSTLVLSWTPGGLIPSPRPMASTTRTASIRNRVFLDGEPFVRRPDIAARVSRKPDRRAAVQPLDSAARRGGACEGSIHDDRSAARIHHRLSARPRLRRRRRAPPAENTPQPGVATARSAGGNGRAPAAGAAAPAPPATLRTPGDRRVRRVGRLPHRARGRARRAGLEERGAQPRRCRFGPTA